VLAARGLRGRGAQAHKLLYPADLLGHVTERGPADLAARKRRAHAETLHEARAHLRAVRAGQHRVQRVQRAAPRAAQEASAAWSMRTGTLASVRALARR
jgi:hypothetical protein